MSQKHPKIHIEEHDSHVHQIYAVPTSFTAFVGLTKSGPLNKAVHVKSFFQFRDVFGESESDLTCAVKLFFINGGRDAVIVSVANSNTIPSEKIIGSLKAKSGIYSLDEATDVNVLCIPPYNSRETTSNTVYKRALEYCKKRHAFLIIDPPKYWQDTKKVKENLKIPSSENAAIYFPRVRTKEKTNVVPCGIVTGVIARTDHTRGVWKSPAGIDATISGIEDLCVKITENDVDELNIVMVNCLRKIQGRGFLVWGASTAKDGEWRYVAVRRTALFIKESLLRGLRWIVFEPNDEPLWASIRNTVTLFMDALFRQGAFAGRTPKEAYFVQCGRNTITQNDINMGRINLEVGFAHLRPAEFIVISIQLSAKN
jgi:phage tail sheath protein FI